VRIPEDNAVGASALGAVSAVTSGSDTACSPTPRSGGDVLSAQNAFDVATFTDSQPRTHRFGNVPVVGKIS
jgi:hypothetical protein